MKKTGLMLVGVMVSLLVCANDEISGRVVAVIDGNTIELLGEDHETYKIMLHGIDCPELAQAYGESAKQHLEKLVLDKSVTVQLKGKDRWGVRLGVISIENTLDPRHLLLAEGLAWTSEVNPNPDFEIMKEEAREKGKGLWKADSPVAPWIFRRQQTMTQFKSS